MASLSASALSQRSKSPELTIAATPRGFGSSGRGAPARQRRRREHLDLEPTHLQMLARVGADPADPASVRLREQAAEVAIGAPVGVLEQ